MRRFTIPTLLVAALAIGCAQSTTDPDLSPVLLHVSSASEEDPLLDWVHSSGLDTTFAPDLGWVEWARTVRADYVDDHHALLVPVEAEDEIRRLCLWFDDEAYVGAVAIGFAETTWFWPDRAETLTTYEGWVFDYDLTDGRRVVARYTPGGSAAEAPAFVVEDGADPCLAVEIAAPLESLTASLFLVRDPFVMSQRIAVELPRFCACLSPS